MLYTTLNIKFGGAAGPEVKDRSLRAAMALDVWAGGRGSGPRGTGETNLSRCGTRSERENGAAGGGHLRPGKPG